MNLNLNSNIIGCVSSATKIAFEILIYILVYKVVNNYTNFYMRKSLVLFLLLPLIAFGQIKVKDLPTTTTGTQHDNFLKDDSAGVSGSTKKINWAALKSLYSIATATGTGSYVGKFTGTTTLGNSIIYDNGTNIGIGTTNPARKLDVQGSIAVGIPNSASGSLYLYNGANTNRLQLTPSTTAADMQWFLPGALGTTGQVLTVTASGGGSYTSLWQTPVAGWSLTGNSGTTAGTNFIGTTDNQPFYLNTKNSTNVKLIGNTITIPDGKRMTGGDSTKAVINLYNGSTSGQIGLYCDGGAGLSSSLQLNNGTTKLIGGDVTGNWGRVYIDNGNMWLSHSVGILMTSPLTYQSGSYASGKVLTSDASGNATWQAIPSTVSDSGLIAVNHGGLIIAAAKPRTIKIDSSSQGYNPLTQYRASVLYDPIAGSSSLVNTGTLTSGATGTGFTINLTSSTVTGLVGVANGAVGISTYVTGDLLIANSSSSLARLAVGSAGKMLTVTGSLPAWTTATYPQVGTATSSFLRADGTNWVASTLTLPNAATTGDLLYASGSNTGAMLNDVATGSALISGGIGTAPSWGKIDLTAHVTGVLPSSNGGTGVNNGGRNLTISTNSGTLAFSSSSLTGTLANSGNIATLTGGIASSQLAMFSGTTGQLTSSFIAENSHGMSFSSENAAQGTSSSNDPFYFIGTLNGTQDIFWFNQSLGSSQQHGIDIENGNSDDFFMRLVGHAVTTSGDAFQDGGYIRQTGVGGLSLGASSTSGDLRLYAGGSTSAKNAVILDHNLNFITNNTGSALSTSATTGFTYLPTCAGTPTGTPATLPTGSAPFVLDTTNGHLMAYYGGAWHIVN